MADTPIVFMSYSHDNTEHKKWVLDLSARLIANGVDVILDQYDLTLGADLAQFMETGLTGSNRVIAVCSAVYTEKANGRIGGTGYESTILTGQMMNDVSTDLIIPLIRNNPETSRPTYLASRRYIDFRNDDEYEPRYSELIHELHGESVVARPKLGPNPFNNPAPNGQVNLSTLPERYVSPALTGTVSFDYSNNNGNFTIGSGQKSFTTNWTTASASSIHAYSDRADVHSIALATGASEFSDINDASLFDDSSRGRNPGINEIVVWQNNHGYYALTKVTAIEARGRNSDGDKLTFDYVIQANRSSDFSGF